nr:AlpA family transcriptional regulator [uncultured Cohaesibacter sp.]
MTEKFLRLPDVEIRVGLRRSAIYEAMKENRFPKPVKLGIRAVAWAESEILCWQQAQIAKRDETALSRKG